MGIQGAEIAVPVTTTYEYDLTAASVTVAEKGASGVGKSMVALRAEGVSGVGVLAMPVTAVYLVGNMLVVAGGAALAVGSVKTLAQDEYRLLQAKEEVRQEVGGGTGSTKEKEIDNVFEKGNYNKVKDSYFKRKELNAHELKKDFLGKKAPIAEYDIYVNKDTGEFIK